MNAPVSALWRRLDAPGHDACRFEPASHGWTLSGMATFLESGRVCLLRYDVMADSGFRTRAAAVDGWVDGDSVQLRIRASGTGDWTLNGVEQPQLSGCVDLDLGFTPATNWLPVRRLDLPTGGEAQAPAAYLAFPQLELEVLAQRYKRLSASDYDYEAPDAGYRDTLKVSPQGVVLSYPGLFRIENA